MNLMCSILHWSQISMYTKCAEQFRRRYIAGDIIPPGVALITGTGMHRAVEMDLTRKLETGELASEEEVKDAARDAVVNEWDGGVFLTEEDHGNEKKLRAESIDTAVNCAAMHHIELAPHVSPKHVERKWVVEVNGYPVKLAGTIDCDEGEIIDDWKTAGKTPPSTTAHESDQITMYSLAKYVHDKIIPKARMGYVIKTKTPKTLWLETTRTKEDFAPLLRVIERISDAIDKAVYPFASSMSPRPWWCSPKWCGYYQTCAGVRNRTVMSIDGRKKQ